jgi:hypothetical protein
MKSTEYKLEIYEPQSTTNVWVQFASPTPFMAINRNDIINPSTWPESPFPRSVLRVTSVEHIVLESPMHVHQLAKVYTEEVPNTTELRLVGGA